VPATETTSGTSAWGALLKVHAALVPMMDAELRRVCGISLSWYDVLLELNSAEDRQLTVGELDSRVVLSRTRISRVVDELAAAGLVERRSHPTDKRSAYVAVTAKGRDVLRKAAPV
jgi:DNA-binding MarR family transcriptional regulator